MDRTVYPSIKKVQSRLMDVVRRWQQYFGILAVRDNRQIQFRRDKLFWGRFRRCIHKLEFLCTVNKSLCSMSSRFLYKVSNKVSKYFSISKHRWFFFNYHNIWFLYFHQDFLRFNTISYNVIFVKCVWCFWTIFFIIMYM